MSMSMSHVKCPTCSTSDFLYLLPNLNLCAPLFILLLDDPTQ